MINNYGFGDGGRVGTFIDKSFGGVVSSISKLVVNTLPQQFDLTLLWLITAKILPIIDTTIATIDRILLESILYYYIIILYNII